MNTTDPKLDKLAQKIRDYPRANKLLARYPDSRPIIIGELYATVHETNSGWLAMIGIDAPWEKYPGEYVHVPLVFTKGELEGDTVESIATTRQAAINKLVKKWGKARVQFEKECNG